MFIPDRYLTEPERLLFGILQRLDPEDAAPLALSIIRNLIVPRGQPATSEQLSALSAQLATAHAATITEIRTMSDSLAQELTQLQADVTQQGSVIASATTAFQGLAAMLAAALQAAKDAGATPEQLAALAAVHHAIETNTAALAAAIPVNTPVEGGVTAGTADGTPISG